MIKNSSMSAASMSLWTIVSNLRYISKLDGKQNYSDSKGLKYSC